MNDTSIQEGTAGWIVACGAAWVRPLKPLDSFHARIVMAGEMEQLTVEPEDGCADSTTQGDRVARNRVEHGLDVGRRLADHAQDLGRRRLLLQPLLRFVEEPHVLDGNHRLVGEGLDETDLLIGEFGRGGSHDGDHTDSDPLAHHWYGQQRPVPSNASPFAICRWNSRILRHVIDLHDLAFVNRPAGNALCVYRLS